MISLVKSHRFPPPAQGRMVVEVLGALVPDLSGSASAAFCLVDAGFGTTVFVFVMLRK